MFVNQCSDFLDLIDVKIVENEDKIKCEMIYEDHSRVFDFHTIDIVDVGDVLTKFLEGFR